MSRNEKLHSPWNAASIDTSPGTSVAAVTLTTKHTMATINNPIRPLNGRAASNPIFGEIDVMMMMMNPMGSGLAA